MLRQKGVKNMARAIVRLEIQWDTDKCNYKTSGAALMRDLENFFAAHGKMAEPVEVVGNSGDRIIELSDMMPSFDPKGKMTQSDVKPLKDQFKNVMKNIPTGSRRKK